MMKTEKLITAAGLWVTDCRLPSYMDPKC